MLLLLLGSPAKASASRPGRALRLLCCAGVCVQLCCQAGPVLQQVCCTQQGVGGADGCGCRLLLVVRQLLPAQPAQGRSTQKCHTRVMQEPSTKKAMTAGWVLVLFLQCDSSTAHSVQSLIINRSQTALTVHAQEPTTLKALLQHSASMHYLWPTLPASWQLQQCTAPRSSVTPRCVRTLRRSAPAVPVPAPAA